MSIELTKDYYTIPEVAALAGVSRATVSYEYTNGRFPEFSYRRGKVFFYSKEIVAKFLETYKPGHQQVNRKKVLARKQAERDVKKMSVDTSNVSAQ